MRLLTACLVTVVLVAGSASAEAPDDCHITPGPNDVVKKRGDVVIEAGRQVEDVIAVQGTVTVKQGARVKTAVALRGDVVIEAGAEVQDNAIALRGTVKVAKGARVKSIIELGPKGVRLVGEDGDVVELNAELNGQSVGQAILTAALAKVKTCKVVEQE